eukprot:CAMPEP_0185038114 /NCGR_PEP_ID=MMETSP1103-20130426/33366_1 /TAXON_ID=36769 /ORGANISM="Paraphysomonas bandaiensis, Strain Caron Lab Isolate" /LENGTH=627 /DNA_ID=CAMNT_0027576401 /DNA_START=260 /DNA_END=2143 /DNA_ORIENTATION=-
MSSLRFLRAGLSGNFSFGRQSSVREIESEGNESESSSPTKADASVSQPVQVEEDKARRRQSMNDLKGAEKIPPSPRKLYSSQSARTLTSKAGSFSSVHSDSTDTTHTYHRFSLEQKCTCIVDCILDELIPQMIIFEAFYAIDGARSGDVDTLSSTQRRMLDRVNSRSALQKAGSRLEILKQEREREQLLSERPQMDRTSSSSSITSTVQVEELNTELLQEMLLEIEQNTMDMPSVLDEMHAERVRKEKGSGDGTMTPVEALLQSPGMASLEGSPFPARSSTCTPDENSPTRSGSRSPASGARTPQRHVPMVPLRRPSWQSPVQPLYLTKKRRPSMAVRLALSESGPFQRILIEGVRVVIHFMIPGSLRPRRIKRLMILDDDLRDEDRHKKQPKHRLLFYKLEAGVLKETEDSVAVGDITDILTGAHTSVFKCSLNQLHGEGISYDKSGTEKRCFTMMGVQSPFDSRLGLDVEIQPMDKQKPEELQAASMISLGVATAIQVLSNLEHTRKESTLNKLFDLAEDDEESGSTLELTELGAISAQSPNKKNARNHNYEKVKMVNSPSPTTFPPPTSAPARHGDTQLSPAVTGLFDGPLPSEKLTINSIMSEVVEMWAEDDRAPIPERMAKR